MRCLRARIHPVLPACFGSLTGKYRGASPTSGERLILHGDEDQVLTAANIRRVEQFEKFAQDRGHTLLELAIGWLLSQSGITTVIASVRNPEQFTLNFESSTCRLPAEDMDAVSAL